MAEWIEMPDMSRLACDTTVSASDGGVDWNSTPRLKILLSAMSPLAMAEWIEIIQEIASVNAQMVSASDGGVDWNIIITQRIKANKVSASDGGVDWNPDSNVPLNRRTGLR